jgi:hypothetical protein
MKKPILLLALFTPAALAQFPDEDLQEKRYVGPTESEVELLSVRETSPFGSKRPLVAEVRNNSDYYLDRVAIQCTLTDERGFRAFKDIVFKSSPLVSFKIEFPPITTQEMGIPPGEVAEVGLYTTDNRWTRGHGKYTYDCRLYGPAATASTPTIAACTGCAARTRGARVAPAP